MKLTLPMHVYLRVQDRYNVETHKYEDKVDVMLYDNDTRETWDPEVTLVGYKEVEVEVDDQLFNPKRLRHDALMREKAKIVQEYTMKLAEVQDRINKFLAIEHDDGKDDTPF